jgi:membrane fusion protein, multidrug efflux system
MSSFLNSGSRWPLRSMKVLIVPVVLCLLMIVVVISKQVRADKSEAEPYFHRVAAMTMQEQQQYAVARRFSGRISAQQHTDMGFELAGKLADVMVDQGEQVKAGQVLATLDTELLRIERRELDAQLAESRARLKLTEANLKRQRSLRQSGFTSEQRLDELQAEREALLANIARLDAAVASVTSRIGKSTLVAPFEGVISHRFTDQGAVVSAGLAVVRVQQVGIMEVHIGVPVRLLSSLRTGEQKPVEINGVSYMARLLAIGADVHPLSRTVNVRLALPDDALAVNGDLAYLQLEEHVQESGFWIPAAAITDGMRGLWSVYILTAEDGGRFRLQARDVQVLHATADKVYVQGALSDGESIAAAGLHRLVPGQQVVTKARNASDVANRLQH